VAKLADEIRTAEVAPEGERLWFLGGATAAVKSGATVAIVDPFLIESPPGCDWKRRSPSLIAPGELHADLVLVTHSHVDHCDAESLAPFFENPETQVLLAPGAYGRVREMGIDKNSVAVEAKSGVCARSGALTVHVLPGGDVEEEDAVAYLIVSESSAVLHPGDSLRESAYELYARYRAGVILIPFGNPLRGRAVYPDEEQFRRFARLSQASVAVPIHWDLRDETFLDAADIFGADEDRIRVLSAGQSMDVPARRM